MCCDIATGRRSRRRGRSGERGAQAPDDPVPLVPVPLVSVPVPSVSVPVPVLLVSVSVPASVLSLVSGGGGGSQPSGKQGSSQVELPVVGGPVVVPVFVVTGGGNGIGREVVLALLAHGGRVAALDLREEGLAETGRLAGAAVTGAGRLTTHVVDVTDRAAVEALPSA